MSPVFTGVQGLNLNLSRSEALRTTNHVKVKFLSLSLNNTVVAWSFVKNKNGVLKLTLHCTVVTKCTKWFKMWNVIILLAQRIYGFFIDFRVKRILIIWTAYITEFYSEESDVKCKTIFFSIQRVSFIVSPSSAVLTHRVPSMGYHVTGAVLEETTKETLPVFRWIWSRKCLRAGHRLRLFESWFGEGNIWT